MASVVRNSLSPRKFLSTKVPYHTQTSKNNRFQLWLQPPKTKHVTQTTSTLTVSIVVQMVNMSCIHCEIKFGAHFRLCKHTTGTRMVATKINARICKWTLWWRYPGFALVNVILRKSSAYYIHIYWWFLLRYYKSRYCCSWSFVQNCEWKWKNFDVLLCASGALRFFILPGSVARRNGGRK